MVITRFVLEQLIQLPAANEECLSQSGGEHRDVTVTDFYADFSQYFSFLYMF